ncbi:MAG: cysteine-rich CWC family protein [Candidatus Tectomicrobia bacterium]|nr:cysteine-rich CWC family protein [Candidatus Tectomicrobia bacterium]
MPTPNPPEAAPPQRPPQSDGTRQKVCPACGAAFRCGGCWCAYVPVSASVLTEISRRYAGCLCADCLRAFAEGRGIVVEEDGQVRPEENAG